MGLVGGGHLGLRGLLLWWRWWLHLLLLLHLLHLLLLLLLLLLLRRSLWGSVRLAAVSPGSLKHRKGLGFRV